MTVQTRAAQNCTAKAEQKLWEVSAFITSLHMRSCFTVLDAFNSIRKQGIHGERHLATGLASMWNAMAESCDVAQLSELQSRLQEARESRTSLKMQMEGEAGADEKTSIHHINHIH